MLHSLLEKPSCVNGTHTKVANSLMGEDEAHHDAIPIAKQKSSLLACILSASYIKILAPYCNRLSPDFKHGNVSRQQAFNFVFVFTLPSHN